MRLKTRLEALDCLRGIAALAVMLGHYVWRFNTLYPETKTFGRTISLDFGGNPIHLFFVISGFVIFMSISGAKKPIDFIRARFFRLFPTFWVSCTFTFCLILIFGFAERQVSFVGYLMNLTMIPVLLSKPGAEVTYVDGSYWTLELEIYFYFIMLALLWTRTIKWIDWIMAGFLVWSVVVSRFLANPSFPADKLVSLTLGNFIPYFIVGIYAYRLRENGKLSAKYAFLLLFTAFMVALKFGREEMVATMIIFSLVYFGSFIQKLPVVFKPLLFLGTISYSLYLVHQTLGFIVLREMAARGVNPHVAFISACAIAIAVATVLCFGVERPVIVFSKRRFARTPDTLQPVTAAEI